MFIYSNQFWILKGWLRTYYLVGSLWFGCELWTAHIGLVPPIRLTSAFLLVAFFCQHIFTVIEISSEGAGLRHIIKRFTFNIIVKVHWFQLFLLLSSCFLKVGSYPNIHDVHMYTIYTYIHNLHIYTSACNMGMVIMTCLFIHILRVHWHWKSVHQIKEGLDNC